MITYDFKCKLCAHTFTTVVDRMGDLAQCTLCGGGTERVFLSPPHYKKKIASRKEKGITRDLIEMSILEEKRDGSRDRHEKFELNREIEKINSTPVTGG